MRAQSKGFSMAITLLIVGLLAVLGLVGWLVWQKGQQQEEKQSQATPASNQKSPASSQPKPTPDPYEGWQTYSNEEYGVSFRYPAEWKIRTINGGQESSAPMTVAFGLYLERQEQVKYNTTVSIEVFDDPINDLDRFYSDKLVKREAGTLKGRPAISYTQQNTEGYQMKRYLFEVSATKTYVFESVNEGTNVDIDSEYWRKFDLTFDSVKIDT